MRGAKLADIEVAAVLEKGELRLDTFRVGALAGARLAGKGRISDLAGKPELALSYDLAAEEGDDLVAFLAPGTKVGEVGALALKGSLSLTSAGVRLKGKGRLGDVSTSLEAAVGLETDAPVAVQAKLGIKNATATAKRFGLALPGEVGAVELALSAIGTAAEARVEARFAGLGGRVDFAGALRGLDANPRLAGDLKLAHPSLKALLAPWSPVHRRKSTADPGRIALSAKLDLDAARTRLDGIEATLGGLSFTGDAILGHGDKPHVVKLVFGDLDVEPLLAMLPPATAKARPGSATKTSAKATLIPTDLAARLAIKAKSIRWRARRFDALNLKLRAEDGALHLETASVGLPAKGRATLVGRLDMVGGTPGFAGDLTLETRNLRPLLALAGVKPPKTRKRRFGRTKVTTKIEARGDSFAARGLTFRLDDTTYRGDIGLTLGARPTLVASLGLDRLIVDDYLPKPSGKAAKAKADPAGGGGLAMLADFDARVGLTFGELGFGGRTLRDGRARALLEKGRLTLRELRIGDAGGAVVTLAGRADKLATRPTYDFDYRVEAAEASALVRWLDPGRGKMPKAGAFDAQGKIKGNPKSLEIVGVAKLAGATADIDARMGLARGAPLALGAKIDAPEPGRLLALAGITAPAGIGPASLSLSVEGRRKAATVDASFDVAGGKLTAKGEIGDLDTTPTANLRVMLDHPAPVVLMKTLGLVAPDAPVPAPVRHTLETRLRLDGKALRLDGIVLAQGSDRLKGRLVYRLATTPPRLNARFSTQRFDLRPLLPAGAKGRDGKKKGRAAKRVFPADPLPWKSLRGLDATVDLKAGRLLLRRLALRNLVTRLTLEGGDLKVQPMKAVIGGGTVQGFIRLSPKAKGEGLFRVNFRAKQVDLRSLLSELDVSDEVRGKLDVDIRLAGRGASFAQIMARSNGRSELITGKGRIDNKLVEAIGGDLALDALPILGGDGDGPYTNINCAVSRFRVKNGIADVTDLVLDTDRTTIVGEGKVNFRNERLDICIDPTPKSGAGADGIGRVTLSLGELAKPFRLAGTLANPKLGLDALKGGIALGKAIGGVVLFGPAGIAAALVSGDAGAAENPCLEAIQRAKQGVSAPEGEGQGGTVERARDQVEDTVKGLGKTLEGLFKR